MTSFQIVSLLLASICLFAIAKRTDFSRILSDKKWQHMVFGSIALVSILWFFRVSIYDGLVIHFLWLTTLTLVLGFRWAILAGTVVLFVSTIIGHDAWSMFGVNALLGVFLPILITYSIFSLSFHHLPRQPFTYIFVCGFFPGAFAIGAKMLALSAYYYLDGVYPMDDIRDNYTVFTLLMVFPEAFFNGFSVTCLVVYKPDLISTFQDKFYIDDK